MAVQREWVPLREIAAIGESRGEEVDLGALRRDLDTLVERGLVERRLREIKLGPGYYALGAGRLEYRLAARLDYRGQR